MGGWWGGSECLEGGQRWRVHSPESPAAGGAHSCSPANHCQCGLSTCHLYNKNTIDIVIAIACWKRATILVTVILYIICNWVTCTYMYFCLYPHFSMYTTYLQWFHTPQTPCGYLHCLQRNQTSLANTWCISCTKGNTLQGSLYNGTCVQTHEPMATM